MIKYGLSWKDGTPAVEIERHCIRHGGKWTVGGVEVGEGLFHHFKAMQSLLWPEDDHHRWSDLILKTIIEGRISVICGCRDSSKTRTVSKWALCDYWCWPNDSLFLMTSTTSQGLEMRVFGDIKSLFERALERCPWLEGNVVDSKRGIFTDNVSDDMDVKKSRDMRKGFIGIPCMTSEGEYAGMALKNFAGIKQKRRRLIGDELQFMSCDYLKVLDSMDKGEFKAVLLGNMIAENGKALDRVSEPINGWDTVDDSPKTKVWKNKYNGITVNLCGPDSPNFDDDTKDKYPYMLSQSDIDSVSARPGGKDSVEWWSQIMGLRKVGVVSDRPFTVNDVRNNKGFEPVIWKTTPQRGLAIDAGYGGDDCVKTVFYWGTDVEEIDVIAFMEQSVYPVLISSKITPEDQIATAAKADCLKWNIPYENVFIEAGMRATLAVSFGRILAPSINAINFGGSATERPVASDLFVKDEKTGQRRLKTCLEHYSKFVTELVFAVRDAVICGQTRLFPMRAAEEFQRRKWRYVYGDRYEIETKLEYKERNASKSPNDSDSIMIAVEGARRRGFKISNARKDDLDGYTGLDWLRERSQKNREMLASKQLVRR